MATIFVSYWTCSLGAEVSQNPLDGFSQSLHHMVDIELHMIVRPSFSDILRDVAMATNLVAEMGQNHHPRHLSLSIQNKMGYRLANTRVYSSANCCTFCEKNGENRLSSF